MFILSKFPSFFQGEMSLRETGFQMYHISFVVENQVQGEWKEGGKGTATTWDTHTALRQCHRTRNANFKRLWHLCRGTACSPWWCLTAHRILKHIQRAEQVGNQFLTHQQLHGPVESGAEGRRVTRGDPASPRALSAQARVWAEASTPS